jgi:hypothetical protein
MTFHPSPRNGGPSKDEPGALRTGRHARPAALPAGTLPDAARDRSADRINAADRALAEAHARLRSAGADPDVINTAFAIARDSLHEARENVRDARKELALVLIEWDQANRVQQNQGRYAETAAPVVPDPPGLDLCPNPAGAQTPAEFMGILRMYRIWAGKPSYRGMEHAIKNRPGQRFAASTIHAALKSDALPALQMVEAIITACGGSDAHHQTFAAAWRRLTMPQQEDARPQWPRALHPVSELA